MMRFPVFARFVLVWLGCISTALAQNPSAPSSVNGHSFFVTITEGERPFGRSGLFLLVAEDSALRFRLHHLSDVADQTNTYTYSANGNQAELSVGSLQYRFLFTNSNAGVYVLLSGGTTSNGYQMGNFVHFSGAGPASLSNRFINFRPTYANYPASPENFRVVITGPRSYVKETSAGSSAPGTFGYQLAGRSTGELLFLDDTVRSGITRLLFTTERTGVFVHQQPDKKSFQIGSFAVGTLSPPTITRQPAHQTVTIGQPAQFTVGVSGTAPLFFQWFKNNTAIPGATRATLVVPFASPADAGNYHVRVRNFMGRTNSQTATLTVQCATTLSTNVIYFQSFLGGNAQVTVSNQLNCTWSAHNTNTWLTITGPTTGTNVSATLELTASLNSNALPRVAEVHIGNQRLVVAQAGQPAPDDLRGMNLIVKVAAGTAEINNQPTGGVYVLSFATPPGSNTFAVVSSGNSVPATNGIYEYQKLTAATARLILSNTTPVLSEATNTLTFTSHRSGDYFAITTNGGTHFGQFVLLDRTLDFSSNPHPGLPDLVWQRTNGTLEVWQHQPTNSTRLEMFSITPSASNWQARATADIDRNGVADTVLQHTTGSVSIAFGSLNSSSLTNAPPLRTVSSAWQVVAAGDFTGDQKPEIVLQHRDGRIALWGLSSSNILVAGILLRDGKPAGAGWRLAAVADVTGDGLNDLVFQHQSTRRIAAWEMVGRHYIRSLPLSPAETTNHRLAAVADFNMDGVNDLAFENTATRKAVYWFLHPGSFTGGTNAISELSSGRSAESEARLVGGSR